MSYKPFAHHNDPRFMDTANENYRTNDITWGIDKHSSPYENGKDDYSPESTISTVDTYLTSIKSFAQRYWPSTPTSRSRLTSHRPSLSFVPPGSATATFVLLCILWYSTSALSSNTGKTILTQFRYPVTLTFIQFGFVGFYCLLFMSPLVRFSKFKKPTRAIIQNTLPMGIFQVVGHMFSSIAISRIPVSTVHTIKALSPLFTVAAYALLFGVRYSSKTYISLLPLTIGVMLACSFDMSASNAIGLLCAFGSALVFVSSNIFFKKIMPSTSGGLSQGTSHKIDKINLLLYSSGMAFLLMIPLWIYYDLPMLIATVVNPVHITHPKAGHEIPHSITYYIFMNGTVNFAQNIIAFVILSSTSPVTYSIASLVKRVAVICIAIVWFNQTVHPVQAFGIVLTFTGLYMYNSAKSDVEKGEKKMRRVEAAKDLILPTTRAESRLMVGTDIPPEFVVAESTSTGLTSAQVYGRPRSASSATLHTFHHPHATSQHQHRQFVQSTNSTKIISPLLNTKLSQTMDTKGSSPVDSYPSPPASLDSPPSDTIPLVDMFGIPGNTHTNRHPYPMTVAVA